MHVIYSDFFHGAGVMAGGPFACGIRDGFAIPMLTADFYGCLGNGDSADKIDIETLTYKAEEGVRMGLIAPLENLKNTKIWVESTKLD